MILLDTNVISELLRAQANPSVLAWLDQRARGSAWISSISVMELHFGIQLLDDGRRKSELSDAVMRLTEATFADRIAVFDADAAEIAGRLAALRRRKGTTVDHRDTQIAGIALARRATLVTRNTGDFVDLEIELVNPWIG